MVFGRAEKAVEIFLILTPQCPAEGTPGRDLLCNELCKCREGSAHRSRPIAPGPEGPRFGSSASLLKSVSMFEVNPPARLFDGLCGRSYPPGV